MSALEALRDDTLVYVIGGNEDIARFDAALDDVEALHEAAKGMCYFLATVQAEEGSPVFGVYTALRDATEKVGGL